MPGSLSLEAIIIFNEPLPSNKEGTGLVAVIGQLRVYSEKLFLYSKFGLNYFNGMGKY